MVELHKASETRVLFSSHLFMFLRLGPAVRSQVAQYIMQCMALVWKDMQFSCRFGHASPSDVCMKTAACPPMPVSCVLPANPCLSAVPCMPTHDCQRCPAYQPMPVSCALPAHPCLSAVSCLPTHDSQLCPACSPMPVSCVLAACQPMPVSCVLPAHPCIPWRYTYSI